MLKCSNSTCVARIQILLSHNPELHGTGMSYTEAWRCEAKVQISFLFHLFPVNIPVLFFILKYGNVSLFCNE